MPTAISRLASCLDQQVTVRGWIYKLHKCKTRSFILLRDGAGPGDYVQVVVDHPQGNHVMKDYWPQQYVEVQATAHALPPDEYAKHKFELRAQVETIIVLGQARPDFNTVCPLQAKLETLLPIRHLAIRHKDAGLIMKIRAQLVKALRQTFDDDMGMTETFPPSFVPNSCEGGATQFALKYPPNKHGSEDITAYLSQSGQLYLETAIPVVGDNYCIANSFRAERSHGPRHLTEFLHAECEWKDVHTLDEHLAKLHLLFECLFKNFLALDDKSGLLTALDKRSRVEQLSKMKIIEMTHKEAIGFCRANEIYADDESKREFNDGEDITEAPERKMIDKIGQIVLLTKFAKAFKSFYMGSDPDDPTCVSGCDVEVPGVGEIVGSGLRVSDEVELCDRIREQGLKQKDYEEYIDLRRYGPAKTSGMGLGVDRVLCWFLDVKNIREVVTWPRSPGLTGP